MKNQPLAASKLIARHGYAATSLRMIAAVLDVQAPSILHLFKTKDRLLIELIVFLSRSCLNFYAALEKLELGADVTLYKMLLEDVNAIAKQDRDLTALFYLPELHQTQFKEAQQQRAQMISHYRKHLEAGVHLGTLRPSNTELAAEQIFQLTETTIIALHQRKLVSPCEQGKATADFVMRSLLVRPRRLTSIAKKALACELQVEC